MITNTCLPALTSYYPLGNTPPVSLTQDLPLELDADILLLGCGDARNVLFTFFADSARRIDVTCCDIEAGIHARNILLYTLLIDDHENQNIQLIWNIYYHWKIDRKSMKLLETQSEKLLQESETIDQWHGSNYGSTVRFCDERSLTSVRSYWSGFTSQGLSQSERKDRLRQMQAAMDGAKAKREATARRKNPVDISSLRSLLPVFKIDAIYSLANISQQWWNSGTMPSSTATNVSANELNPAFLFSPNQAPTIWLATAPLLGFPLSTAYVPMHKGVFCQKNKNASSVDHLVDCAMTHFTQWALAFRKAVKQNSVIRIFSGDALAFCFTLRNCQCTQSRTMNAFCHSKTNSPLILHHSDYGHNSNKPAPLSFDIVDTSNLVDHLGPLNVVAVGSNLLKHHCSSTLYTETLVEHGNTLGTFFGVDVSLMSLLLGLVMPDLFINASNSVDEGLIPCEIKKILSAFDSSLYQNRSRLRWKRIVSSQASKSNPFMEIEAESLARFLVELNNTMYAREGPSLGLGSVKLSESIPNCIKLRSDDLDKPEVIRELMKLQYPRYNRASFAFLLSIIKANVVSNWEKCLKMLYEGINKTDCTESNRRFEQDMIQNLYVFNIDDSRFPKPALEELNNAILAPVLPSKNDVPDLLCVTIRVRREHLSVFTSKKQWKLEPLGIVCSFESRNEDKNQWRHMFSTIQITFGQVCEQTSNDNSSHVCIKEDIQQLWGTADLFISVMVPTMILLQSKEFVPIVRCLLIDTRENIINFQKELGADLCFSHCEMTSEDVFITRYMPGMSAIPQLSPKNVCLNPTDASAAMPELQLTRDFKIGTLRFIRPDWAMAPTPLTPEGAPVVKMGMKFTSLLNAHFEFESDEANFEFLIPVSRKVKIMYKRLKFFEIHTHPFDRSDPEMVLHLFPTFLMEAPCGIVIPAPWTAARVDLDVMPKIDLSDKKALSWLKIFFNRMFSTLESVIRKFGHRVDSRTNFKGVLYSIFMKYAGLQGQKSNVFGLNVGNDLLTLIFPACLRLDPSNSTVILDCAVIPLTLHDINHQASKFIQQLRNNGLCQISIDEVEDRAWKALLPASIERCRTWKHRPDCEYIKAGVVPPVESMRAKDALSICSCGFGKFPISDYLKDQIERFPDLQHLLLKYGTRAAISPIFAVPHVEDCLEQDLPPNSEIANNSEQCEKCGAGERKGLQEDRKHLLRCSKCKKVLYCSTECQRADWKGHKPFCKAE